MFESDILEDERRCYEYFKNNNIERREQLRKCYKTNPITNVPQAAAEYMFAKFRSFQKEQEKRLKSKNEKKNGTSLVFVINDLHIPEHDEKAVKIVFECIIDNQPDELVLNGDIIDCYWASRFLKKPDNKVFIQQEADMFYRMFSSLRKHIPNTKITYILGNHEDRIEKRMIEDPAFFGIKNLSIKKLLRLDELGIHLTKQKYEIKDLVICHGEKCSSRSGYTAKAEFEAHKMRTGISGHVHRLGCHYRSSEPDDTTKWYENACLCKKDPDYIKGPVDWQTGFSIVKFFPNRSPQINSIEIDNNTFEWNGIIYI